MSEDPPAIEVWVLVAEAALVLFGAWLWEGGVVRWGEFIATWALPTAILCLVAGAFVPWTRGVPRAARALSLVLVLGASAAVVTGLSMAGILVLSVIRTGLFTSEGDLQTSLVTGVPSGAWLGAVAGVVSGTILAGSVAVVEAILKVPPSEERPGALTLVPVAAGAMVLLAGVAELQHWAPTSSLAACGVDCDVWGMRPSSRWLGSGLAVVGVAGGLAFLLDLRRWRALAGVLVLLLGGSCLALGHTVFRTTTGPRFRRATLGLPSMAIPVRRTLVDAEVDDRPGWLWHTVRVTWPDGERESIVVAVGPFRPDTDDLVGTLQDTAERWRAGRIPGRLDE